MRNLMWKLLCLAFLAAACTNGSVDLTSARKPSEGLDNEIVETTDPIEKKDQPHALLVDSRLDCQQRTLGAHPIITCNLIGADDQLIQLENIAHSMSWASSVPPEGSGTASKPHVKFIFGEDQEFSILTVSLRIESEDFKYPNISTFETETRIIMEDQGPDQVPNSDTPLEPVMGSGSIKSHSLHGNTEPSPFDYASFLLHEWEGTATNGTPTGPPVWDISLTNTDVAQKENTHASVFYDPNDYDNFEVTGQFITSGRSDGDYFGFVVGMENTGKFCVFHWIREKQKLDKKSEKSVPGMRVDRIHSKSGGLTPKELWELPQAGNDLITPIAFEGTAWRKNTTYDFRLQFYKGDFTIEVHKNKDGRLMGRFEINDSQNEKGCKAGKVGLYSYSQRDVIYRNFKIKNNHIKAYQNQVQVPEGYASLALVNPPAGMQIDQNGLISWEKPALGTYHIKVSMENSEGKVAVEEHILNVE